MFVRVIVHRKAPILKWSIICPFVLAIVAQLWMLQLLNTVTGSSTSIHPKVVSNAKRGQLYAVPGNHF